MRRNEFKIESDDRLQEVLDQSQVGDLGIIDNTGYPRIIPLNFIYYENAIFFHGASEGEKFHLYQNNPKVTFSVVIPYSIIPSYWIAKDFACPATSFFCSVHIRGKGEIIKGLDEKAQILNLFMGKYQPEGGYKKIDPIDSLYKKALIEVTVFKIIIEQYDIKEKLGQNLSTDKKLEIIEHLEKRNQSTDQETADEMKKTLNNDTERLRRK